MKAFVCHATDEDIASVKLENWQLPPLGNDDVRIRVRAAAVNFPDILTIQGKYQHKPPLPYVPGMEAAGDVIAVGNHVANFKVGDRVIASGIGSFAEEKQVPSSAVRLIPGPIDYDVAAGFTAAYLTAYVALVRRANLQRGEWLLVHGAAGGVGLAAVDLGRLLGARVIATASSHEKRSFLKSYGAQHVLPPDDFRESVKTITGGLGADVIYDPVGGDVFDQSVRCIAFDGRILVVGFTSGRIPTISVNMPLIKGYSIMGVRAGEYGRKFPDRGRENIAAIDRMLAAGRLNPHIHARLPLARAVDAMRLLQEREAIGKVIVEA
ncbi:MAG: NADPH:quinone oxidoreductase family protein [Alphaproteobacteria bacterium]|jgi:NADPH2:quinone reductase|nr:NADPH:quinone oxidoreductase family protein [Alphaproteobacteria bacterium]MBN9577665.1 NADPH:quinone oxidoreductase family protein [Alphaproteobacteria bacterium]MBN9593024.1 NADPH:quinone oxidoreductase family protein [Alphaproteobacteria bacterium]